MAVAAVAGYFGYEYLPLFLNWLISGDLPSSYADILKHDILVGISGQLAIGATALALLGLVIPALIDAMAVAGATKRIKAFSSKGSSSAGFMTSEFMAEFGELPALQKNAADYTRFLSERDIPTKEGKSSRKTEAASQPSLKATAPANTFFCTETLVDQRLFGWFFRSLPSFVLAVGLIIFILTSLIGFHSYKEALPLEPRASASLLWTWIEQGMFSLSFVSIGALSTLLIVKATLGMREAQLATFCRFLDDKFDYVPQSAMFGEVMRHGDIQLRLVQSQMDKIAPDFAKALHNSHRELAAAIVAGTGTLEDKIIGSIEASLRAPLEKLTEATKILTQEQADLVQQMVKSALTGFVQDLQKRQGDQLQQTHAVLKSTASLSVKMEKNFIEAIKNLARQSKEQTDAAGAISKETAKAMAGLMAFEKALTETVAAVQPTLDKVLQNQAALLVALGEEKSAGKSISQAAGEMSKAARASKETVQSFVTLAERLREASRTMSAAGAGGLPGDGIPASKLGDAVKALREKADITKGLPKL